MRKTPLRKKSKDSIRECLVCKGSFSCRDSPSRMGRGKVCSRNCFYLYERKNPRTFKCRKCNEIVPNKNHKKNPIFCSNLCRIKNFIGRKLSPETRRKMSLMKIGSKSHLWRGGIWPENKKERNRVEYKLWREAVFRRDKWTCIECGKKNCYLNADHIKPYSLYPELRHDVNNGRTLCVECHRQTPTFGEKCKTYEKK